MYNVYNPGEAFYLWDINNQKMSFIGNEKELILFLSRGFRYDYIYEILRNTYFEKFVLSQSEYDNSYYEKRWQFFDGFNRIIDIRIYKNEAFILYKRRGRRRKYCSIQNHKYKGSFRKEPVEGIHKYKGSYVKPRRIKAAVSVYFNPEYKGFNRGSKKDYPGWYDDFSRHIEKSWKRQSKRRHQWKEK